jgi:Ran GTPase-activating protein (RanGAP) involved in mRNA processing and transport
MVVDELHKDMQCRYSTVSELLLLLKQLRLNDPIVTRVEVLCRKLPTAYLDSFFLALSANKIVARVKLLKCNITDEVVVTLTNFLRSNRHVKDLDLSGNDLSDVALEELTATLKALEPSQQSLRRLVLHGNHFTGRGIQRLCDVIPQTKIQNLKLGKMPIDERGLHGLSKLLMDPKCPLSKLDLRSSNLGSSGVSVLWKALAINTSLEFLCVRNSCIDDNAVLYLVQALRSNVTLRALDVQQNPISDIGAACFAACLEESNCFLTRLNLKRCDSVSDEMNERVLASVALNSSGPELALRTKHALSSLPLEESSISESSSTMFHENALCEMSVGDNLKCVICFENMAGCILLPCKHQNCCSDCALKLRSCHMCRQAIGSVFKPAARNKIESTNSRNNDKRQTSYF